MVHARAAADALQGFAHLLVGVGLRAAIVQQHQVHFLRPVQLARAARAGDEVEVGGDVQADRAAREQAVQRHDVGEFRHDFFYARNRNMHGWHGGAQAAIAFVFNQTQRAGLGDGEIHA